MSLPRFAYACGVRVTELPIMPEKILRGLKSRATVAAAPAPESTTGAR